MFRPVKVFDVSQTDGKPCRNWRPLSGNVQNYEAFMEALRRSAPVPLSVEPMAANMDGYFSPDQQRIAIRAGMSEVQTVSAAVHEIAHSKLHELGNGRKEPRRWRPEAGDQELFPGLCQEERTQHRLAEVEAEWHWRWRKSEEDRYPEPARTCWRYIANWSQGRQRRLKELEGASLETINKAAGELIETLTGTIRLSARSAVLTWPPSRNRRCPSRKPHRSRRSPCRPVPAMLTNSGAILSVTFTGRPHLYPGIYR